VPFPTSYRPLPAPGRAVPFSNYSVSGSYRPPPTNLVPSPSSGYLANAMVPPAPRLCATAFYDPATGAGKPSVQPTPRVSIAPPVAKVVPHQVKQPVPSQPRYTVYSPYSQANGTNPHQVYTDQISRSVQQQQPGKVMQIEDAPIPSFSRNSTAFGLATPNGTVYTHSSREPRYCWNSGSEGVRNLSSNYASPYLASIPGDVSMRGLQNDSREVSAASNYPRWVSEDTATRPLKTIREASDEKDLGYGGEIAGGGRRVLHYEGHRRP